MDELMAFVRARLAEDERLAQRAWEIAQRWEDHDDFDGGWRP
jgi:hypothetical protein